MFPLRIVLLVVTLMCWGNQDVNGFYVIPYGYGDAYRPPTPILMTTTAPPTATNPPIVDTPSPVDNPETTTMAPPTTPPPPPSDTTPAPPVVTGPNVCFCPRIPVPIDQQKIVLKCHQHCNYVYPDGTKVPEDKLPEFLKGSLPVYQYISEPNVYGQTSIMVSNPSDQPASGKVTIQTIKYPSGDDSSKPLQSVVQSSFNIPLHQTAPIKGLPPSDTTKPKETPPEDGSIVQKDIVAYLSDPNAFGQTNMAVMKTSGVYSNLPLVSSQPGSEGLGWPFQPVYNPWIDPYNLNQSWFGGYQVQFPNAPPLYSVIV